MNVRSLKFYHLLNQDIQIDCPWIGAAKIEELVHLVNDIAGRHSISNHSFKRGICL